MDNPHLDAFRLRPSALLLMLMERAGITGIDKDHLHRASVCCHRAYQFNDSKWTKSKVEMKLSLGETHQERVRGAAGAYSELILPLATRDMESSFRFFQSWLNYDYLTCYLWDAPNASHRCVLAMTPEEPFPYVLLRE